MMLKIPNEDVCRSLVHKIEDEYDLENRLNRYKNQSELVELASNQGLTEIDDAVRALFVADFIVTASELPSGGSDEERYRSVIHSFLQGRSRCSSSDSLMRIFYLAYKTATTIRRQDLFMAGRGLSRKATLIRLKDSYITPYLAVVSELLGKGPCGWELGILSAAMKRMYPDDEIQKFGNLPQYTEYKALTEPIWRLMISYSEKQVVETNPNPIIPNMNESKAILLLDAQQTSLVSLWNTTPSNALKLQVELPSIVKFLNQPLDGKQLVLMRGSILDTMEHFFIVRDPFTRAKPIFVLKTPADELNLSEVLTILQLRGLEHGGWKSLFTSIEEHAVKPKEKPIIISEEIAAVPEVETVEPPVKEGFFGKIKRVLFGKKAKPPVKERSIPKPRKIKLPKEVKKEKKQSHLPQFMSESSFITQGITVDAVGDMNLFDLFDTVREESYYVVGTFETDFKKTDTFFLTRLDTLPNTVITFFNGLDQEISKLYKTCFDDNRILIEELFLIAEDNQKLILSLNGNQERVVGTIATTSVEIAGISQQIADWQSRAKDVEPLPRRSLHMRTNQLLAARRHTPFNEAVERIYGSNFNIEAAKLLTVDQPIFSLQ
ncbi:MAG: hypothetical protein ACFFB5_10165 [Promethearchaeota archaeon]